MSRPQSAWVEETPGSRFRQALADASARALEGAFNRRRADYAALPPSLPIEALLSIDDIRTEAAGSASHWAAALAWLEVEEREQPTAPAPALRRAKDDSLETIRGELGLAETLTFEEIGQLRRLFMWRNHPDRQDPAERESATRRVALANMLLDEAEARLANARAP